MKESGRMSSVRDYEEYPKQDVKIVTMQMRRLVETFSSDLSLERNSKIGLFSLDEIQILLFNLVRRFELIWQHPQGLNYHRFFVQCVMLNKGCPAE